MERAGNDGGVIKFVDAFPLVDECTFSTNGKDSSVGGVFSI